MRSSPDRSNGLNAARGILPSFSRRGLFKITAAAGAGAIVAELARYAVRRLQL